MARAVGVIVGGLLWLVPAAQADWRLFVPHTLETGAFLDLFATSEKDDNRTVLGRQRWDDRFFKEKLTLFTNGYVYHPRFLLYQVSFAEALRQERYRSSFTPPSGNRRGSGFEYEARVEVLPEHAYTLDLFALRYQPLFKEQYATQHNLVETSRGVGFRYRQKPYFARLHYTDQAVESATATSSVRQLASSGEYYHLFRNGVEVAVSAAFNPTRFQGSGGLGGTSVDASAGNTLGLRWLRMQTLVDRSTIDQDESGGHIASRRLSWQELMTATLPGHLRADLTFHYLRATQQAMGEEGTNVDLSSVSRDLQLVVEHRLFESLRTALILRDGHSSSGEADSKTQSQDVDLAYSKSVPTGHLLANVAVGRSAADGSGPVDIVAEAHPGLAVPGAFDLGHPFADRSSLVVILRSPLPPFEAIQLQERTHYSVELVGNSLRITVFALPPQFVVPGSYEVRVSYALATGNFRLRADTLSYGASLQLFNDRVKPYYSYSTVHPRVVSGLLPGAGLDTTTVSSGLMLHFGPLRLRGELQRLRWELAPYHARLFDLQYVSNLGPTTSANAVASYVVKDYGVGTGPGATAAHTERSRSAGLNLQQQLFSRRLSVSIGGSYNRIESLLRSEAYAFNAALTCRVGKLDLSAGGSAYRSKTEGLAALENQRSHHYYYAKVRRQLL